VLSSESRCGIKVDKQDFAKIDKILHYHTKNQELLETALTHSSYANVNKKHSYERLEYLGDSILSFVTREYLFEHYKDLPEGQLTKIQSAVLSERSLASLSEKLNLAQYIQFVPEFEGQQPKRSIVADIIESIIACIYLDGGIKPVKKFILDNFSEKFELARKGDFFKDYITEINEIAQKNHWTVEYKVLKSEYTAQKSYFLMELIVNGKKISKGEGENKKDAMRAAAKKAIESKKIKNND